MPKSKSKTLVKSNDSYPEIQEIREDLNSLRTNVVELTKHIKENGGATKEQLKKRIEHGIEQIQTSGKEYAKEIENHVKEKPGQSLLAAFALGLFTSFMLGHRR